jgi:hypothetical protein
MKKINEKTFSKLQQKHYRGSAIRPVIEEFLDLKRGEGIIVDDAKWKLSSPPAQYFSAFLRNEGMGWKIKTTRLIYRDAWAIFRYK